MALRVVLHLTLALFQLVSPARNAWPRGNRPFHRRKYHLPPIRAILRSKGGVGDPLAGPCQAASQIERPEQRPCLRGPSVPRIADAHWPMQDDSGSSEVGQLPCWARFATRPIPGNPCRFLLVPGPNGRWGSWTDGPVKALAQF